MSKKGMTLEEMLEAAEAKIMALNAEMEAKLTPEQLACWQFGRLMLSLSLLIELGAPQPTIAAAEEEARRGGRHAMNLFKANN